MKEVLLTALGVGGATVIGSALGFAFKKISHKFTSFCKSFYYYLFHFIILFEILLEDYHEQS